MIGTEHFAEAEQLLREAGTVDNKPWLVDVAQVHATLAVAARLWGGYDQGYQEGVAAAIDPNA